MSATKRMAKFERECRSVAEQTDTEVHIYYNKRGNDCIVDDGFLHITRRGIRAAFSVDPSQDNPAEQNRRTREILALLDIPITDRALTEEPSEADNEYCACPHCKGH